MSKKTASPQELLSESLMTAAAGVLGSMLIDENAVGPMLTAVDERDFQLPEQRNVFRAIRDLYSQRRPVDGITVSEQLGGGYREYLARLIQETPTSANADVYAALLKKSSRLWQLRQLGTALEQAEDEEACRTLIDKANLLFCERSGVRKLTMEQGFREFFKRHDGSGRKDTLRWGFSDLDDRLNVGRGDMVVIGGCASAGKTAFALQLAFHVARNKRVGFFSYETDADKLHDRTVACQTHTSFGRIMRNNLDQQDYSQVKDMRGHLTGAALELLETSGMTVSGIGAYAMANHYDVIFVDYLQKIPGAKTGRAISEFERVSQVSSDLQQLGRTTGMTVVALSQLNRAEKGKDGKIPPPSLSSLRQSGQIEQDADVVLLLYKEYQDFAYSRRVLDIAKNKDGVAGEGMLLNFDGDKQRFSKSNAQMPVKAPQEDKPKQMNMFHPVEAVGPTPFDAQGA